MTGSPPFRPAGTCGTNRAPFSPESELPDAAQTMTMAPAASTSSAAGSTLPVFLISYLVEAEKMRWEYRVTLNAVTLEMTNPPAKARPFWTELGFKQCSHCPLNPSRESHCPLALHLAELIERCSALISYEGVHVTVTTPQRTIVKKTTAQRAIGSLMGLIMASSGCPHTRFFRPMARFHLPFADEQETIYRSASSYLLAQYLRKQEGLEPDFDMAGLKQFREHSDAELGLLRSPRACGGAGRFDERAGFPRPAGPVPHLQP